MKMFNKGPERVPGFNIQQPKGCYRELAERSKDNNIRSFG